MSYNSLFSEINWFICPGHVPAKAKALVPKHTQSHSFTDNHTFLHTCRQTEHTIIIPTLL